MSETKADLTVQVFMVSQRESDGGSEQEACGVSLRAITLVESETFLSKTISSPLAHTVFFFPLPFSSSIGSSRIVRSRPASRAAKKVRHSFQRFYIARDSLLALLCYSHLSHTHTHTHTQETSYTHSSTRSGTRTQPRSRSTSPTHRGVR